MLPYGLVILFGSIGLVAYFDFVTRASWVAKVIVSGIFIFSLESYLGRLHAINSLVGSFLLVALSIFIIFYRIFEQARSGKE